MYIGFTDFYDLLNNKSQSNSKHDLFLAWAPKTLSEYDLYICENNKQEIVNAFENNIEFNILLNELKEKYPKLIKKKLYRYTSTKAYDFYSASSKNGKNIMKIGYPICITKDSVHLEDYEGVFYNGSTFIKADKIKFEHTGLAFQGENGTIVAQWVAEIEVLEGS